MSHHDQHDDHEHGEHHILSNAMGLKILLILIVMTVLTVVTARIDLGHLNGPIAIFIACFKAMLVILFFMGMKYDSNDNRAFFASSFVFFGVFVVLTAADVFTRVGDWRTHGPELKATMMKEIQPKFWEDSEESLKRGATLFKEQCVTCHGSEGHGDGPASAGLNPKPRNFTLTADWKNGRTVTGIVTTLNKGLGSMPSFDNFPLPNRFDLAHYVLTLNAEKPATPTADQLKAVGVLDPSKDDGGLAAGGSSKSIPIEFAIDRYVEASKK